MTMRLLDGDRLATSMTGSQAGSSLTTQASNFSFRKRSAASPVITTVSTPNWRKQSAKIARVGSLRSIRAARAALFLMVMEGDRVPRALSRKDMLGLPCKPIVSRILTNGKGLEATSLGTEVL